MTDHQLTRRAAVSGVVALPLLAACGSEGGDGAAGMGSPSSAAAGTTSAPAGDLAAAADIPVGGGVIFGDRDVVVTQPEAGVFKAFSATCTHQACQVTKVADGTIDCACHGSRFSISDGSVEGGPAPSPLPERQITVANDQISLA